MHTQLLSEKACVLIVNRFFFPLHSSKNACRPHYQQKVFSSQSTSAGKPGSV